MNLKGIEEDKLAMFCVNQHDIVCNQKYGGDFELPYSVHLLSVAKQVDRYKHLLPSSVNLDNVTYAALAHDLIEDARCSYNDIVTVLGEEVAEIVFCCTDEKGKNRNERHSDKFFVELGKNRIAVFIKLCDIMANVLFSMMTNSDMYNKYQSEFVNVREKLYVKGEYTELWDDLLILLKL